MSGDREDMDILLECLLGDVNYRGVTWAKGKIAKARARRDAETDDAEETLGPGTLAGQTPRGVVGDDVLMGDVFARLNSCLREAEARANSTLSGAWASLDMRHAGMPVRLTLEADGPGGERLQRRRALGWAQLTTEEVRRTFGRMAAELQLQASLREEARKP